jgi:hypothetical protein
VPGRSASSITTVSCLLETMAVITTPPPSSPWLVSLIFNHLPSFTSLLKVIPVVLLIWIFIVDIRLFSKRSYHT